MGKLLLTIIVADLKWFILKNKPVIYTRTFIELYNWKTRMQVYKIYEMIEFEKMHTLTAENLCNLSAYWIIQISLILSSVHIIFRNQEKFIFYINNCIHWD